MFSPPSPPDPLSGFMRLAEGMQRQREWSTALDIETAVFFWQTRSRGLYLV